MNRVPPFVLTIASLLIGVLVIGCVPQARGYALLLWPEDGKPFTPGDIVPIYNEPRRGSAAITRLNDDEYMLDTARLELFASKEAAQDRLSELSQEHMRLTAISRQRALPVRNRPDPESRVVYRLEQEEVVRVLDREEEEQRIADNVGRWYHVITEDGTMGHVFSARLSVVDSEGTIVDGAMPQDIPSEAMVILEHTWRPEDYADLVADETPVLEELNPEYGMFTDTDAGEISLVFPEGIEKTIAFHRIDQLASDHFRVTGSSLEIRRESARRLTLFFEHEEQEYTVPVARLRRSLESVISEEEQRRERAREQFVEEDHALVSRAYGTITFDDDRFTWEGMDRLRPNVVPEAYADYGEMVFRYFLHSDLRRQYDGAVSFRFEGAPDDKLVTFLYELEPRGVRLTHVPQASIRDYVVRDDAGAATVLFFQAVEEDEDEETSDISDW